MKLSLKLIKDILTDVESAAPGQIIQSLTYEDYDDRTVSEHVELLIEEGLLHGSITPCGGKVPDTRYVIYAIFRMTMDGHNFLRDAKNDTVWKKLVSEAAERGDSVSMSVLQGLAGKLAETFLGERFGV